MKKFKKWLAAVSVLALAFSGMPVSAAQDATGLADGTAYLNINNAAWGEFEAEWTNAEITGDGSYTVSMTATEAQDLAQFNALEVVNGESVLGTGCVLTVDSISINGEAVELQGPSYTCSADGAGVNTRVNIYNEWNAPDEAAVAGEDSHPDQRVASGNLMDATACLFSSDYLTGVTSIEVSFTVSGYGTQAAAGSAAGAVATAEQTAFLMFSDRNWAYGNWDATLESATTVVNGDGTYTVTLNAADVKGETADPVTGAQVLCVDVVGLGASVTDVSAITVSDVVVEADGTAVAVDTSKIVTGDIEENGNFRIEIFNEYGKTVEDSPIDQNAFTFADTLSVTFTLGGIVYGAGDAGAADAPAPTAGPVDLDGTYHAYLGFQTPKYSFRNAFDDATYGRDTSEVFNQVTGWDADNNAVVLPGTFTDVEIKGNGTYTVSVDGLSFPDGEFADQGYLNLLFLSTDIPNTGEITISDVEVTMDGKAVDLASVGAIVSPDSVNYLNMLIQNIWNKDGVAEIGYYTVPMTNISITFTVSGFNYDAEATAPETTPDTAPAETEPAASESTESGSNTTVIIIVVVAVVVVVAAVAGVLVAKKKKAAK